MKNITELRQELAKIFAELKAGTITAKDAGELNNTAGKMINSVKVELEYYALRKETPTIRFMEQ